MVFEIKQPGVEFELIRYLNNSGLLSCNLSESTATPSTGIVTGGGPLPEAFMRIVNGEGQTVTTAEVGQILYAEVILRDANGSLSKLRTFPQTIANLKNLKLKTRFSSWIF